jgi:cyclopropane fatty-acyl-phospholipid synthase-like methyltransferase
MPHSPASPVGEFYDQVTDVTRTVYDENLHYGYWPDPAAADGSLAEATERMTGELITRLDARPGHHVLDIGCGTGRPALRLARETGARVTGITVSRHQVTIATTAARDEGLHRQVRFEHADAAHLPYDDASFDRALALESMFHMPDRARVLKEAARVLRPGGRLAVADIILREPVHDPAHRTVVERFCALMRTTSVERIDAYPALVEAAGLELLEITDVTAHTSRTTQEILGSLRALRAQDVGQDEEEFNAHLETMEGVAALPHFGYVFLTARKP